MLNVRLFLRKVFLADTYFIKIKEAIKWTLTFAILSILLLVGGHLILFFFTDTDGIPCSNISNSWLFYLKTIFLQCVCFFIVTLLTIKWIYRKHYYLIFPITQFLLFNAVFFLNIELIDSKLKFCTTSTSFAYDCFSYSGNIIADFLYCKIPMYGLFDGGFFAPDNTIYVYILLVVSPFIYFTILTRLCSFIVRKKLTQKK